MKRTTIMAEEALLYELKEIARRQERSLADVIREALGQYVVEQQEQMSAANPLLALAGIGASAEATDLSDGQDEAVLAAEIDPIHGWTLHDGHSR